MVSLKDVKLKNGEVLDAVSIYENGCIIPGFVACERGGDIVYIAISNITSFTVENAEKAVQAGGTAPLVNLLVPLLDARKGN